MSLQLAEVFVQITQKGFSAVQASLAKIKKTGDEISKAPIKSPKSFIDGIREGEKGLRSFHRLVAPLQQSLAAMGSAGKVAFAGITGAMFAGVKIASPGDFQKFTDQLQLVGGQIGLILLPLFKELTGWISRLSMWLAGLSREQKENYLHWAKIALAVSAVVVVGTKFALVAIEIGMGIHKLGILLNAMGISSSGAFALGPLTAYLAMLAIIGIAIVGVNARLNELQKNKDKYEKGDYNTEEYKTSFAGKAIEAKKTQAEQLAEAKAQEKKYTDAYNAKLAEHNQKSTMSKGLDVVVDTAGQYITSKKQTDSEMLDIWRKNAGIAKSARERLEKGGTGAPKESADPFSGIQARQAPQLMAITDAWKKVQESAQGDTFEQLKKLQEQQLELQKRGTQATEKIAENTSRTAFDDKGGAGADF